jgi:hypothetical protein
MLLFRMFSFRLFPGVCSLNANVSEHPVCTIFIGEDDRRENYTMLLKIHNHNSALKINWSGVYGDVRRIYNFVELWILRKKELRDMYRLTGDIRALNCRRLWQAGYIARVGNNWILTLSLLMSYIYGAPSIARNLTSYIYGRDFLLGILLLEPCISLIYAWKTNKYTNYPFSLLIMYGSSYMLRNYIAIFRERS